MTEQNHWEERYRTGSTPWDTGRPDFNLTDMVTKRPIRSCRALEIGCGTGAAFALSMPDKKVVSPQESLQELGRWQ